MRSQTRLIRFDEQAVPGTSSDTLRPELWQRFRTVLSPKSNTRFLEKMKLITRDGDGAPRATVSGLLMANDAPEEHLPNAFIQVVC